MTQKPLDFSTRAVFYPPEEHSQSINYPLYMSANFEYGGDIYDQIVDGARKDVNIYSRCGNPTEYKLEEHIAQLTGGTLAEGLHTVQIRATDEHGQRSSVAAVTFTLDTTPPATPEFDLSLGSDTAPVSD